MPQHKVRTNVCVSPNIYHLLGVDTESGVKMPFEALTLHVRGMRFEPCFHPQSQLLASAHLGGQRIASGSCTPTTPLEHSAEFPNPGFYVAQPQLLGESGRDPVDGSSFCLSLCLSLLDLSPHLSLPLHDSKASVSWKIHQSEINNSYLEVNNVLIHTRN